MKSRKTPSPELVREVVDRIVRSVAPLRVVLFGSAARGEMTEDSDLDLLIVVRSGVDCGETEEAVYRTLWGVGFAVDVLVVDETELPGLSKNPYNPVHEAVARGHEVYPAAR